MNTTTKLFTLTVLLGSTLSSAAFLPVCERTLAVKQNLETQLAKPCADILEVDLLTLKRVAVNRKGITVLKKDDFSGLKNLEILNIRANLFTELPEGLFDDLGNLKTLVLFGSPLRHFPDDFLAKTPLMENLHIFRNPLRSISESVMVRLEGLQNIKVIDVDDELQEAEKARLLRIFPAGGRVELNFN